MPNMPYQADRQAKLRHDAATVTAAAFEPVECPIKPHQAAWCLPCTTTQRHSRSVTQQDTASLQLSQALAASRAQKSGKLQLASCCWAGCEHSRAKVQDRVKVPWHMQEHSPVQAERAVRCVIAAAANSALNITSTWQIQN